MYLQKFSSNIGTKIYLQLVIDTNVGVWAMTIMGNLHWW